MAKRILILLTIISLALILLPLIREIKPQTSLNSLAAHYVAEGPRELGAANLVTSVVVTYRGLDTLGEVAVLFIATAGVGFVMKKTSIKKIGKKRLSSEITRTGAGILMPLIALFGIYIFLHGHLTPGGGFQGGVVLASAFLLLLLTGTDQEFRHFILNLIESLSGVFYLGIGFLGLILAGGFLDSRFLPVGNLGDLLSAGAIPVIYSLIGLKVGAELVGILENLQGDEICQ